MSINNSLASSKFECFYINLDEDTERKDKLLSLFDACPLLSHQLRRIPAVNGQQLDAGDIEALEIQGLLRRGAFSLESLDDDPTSRCHEHLPRRAIACALSHRKSWIQLLDRAKSDNVRFAMVLQDNVSSIADDFDTRFNMLLRQIPNDFDLCYIGYHGAIASGAHLEINRCNSFSEQRIYGTFGYLVSVLGAQKLLSGSSQGQSLFPLACRLDSAMSQMLGSIKAYRVGQNAALLCGVAQSQVACCDGANILPQKTWKPQSDNEHHHFLSLLRRLAEAPQSTVLNQKPNHTESSMRADDIKELKLQLQHHQEQLSELRQKLSESQACCQKLEAENLDLKRMSEMTATPSGSLDATSTTLDGINTKSQASTCEHSPSLSKEVESPPDSRASEPHRATTHSTKPKLDVLAEVARICVAQTPAEVLDISADSDDAAMQKAWKKLVFALHPDKLQNFSEADKIKVAEALQSVHTAKDEFRENSQASGLVDVPEILISAGRPVCTRNVPGQRRFECSWEVPEKHDSSRPVEKYEVYGPRIFAHTGEPMEWVLLATLPKIEGCFVFVEESPTQQEVMWAADKIRSPSIPLTVYAINGRGRSEALYIHLPWQTKFPWLQGRNSVICRQCCCVQPRPLGKNDKFQCSSCDNLISPNAAAVVINCPECHGEAMWDDLGMRLDCRCCGRCLAKVSHRQPPKGVMTARGVSTPPKVSSWKNGHGSAGTRQVNIGNGGSYNGHGRWGS